MAAENAQFQNEIKLNINVKNYVLDSLFNGLQKKPYLTPFKLIIDPKDLYDFTNKVKKIEYIWGDGFTDTVDFKIITTTNGNLPYPLEIGTPLNYKKEHVFYSESDEIYEYNITVRVYFFNSSTIEEFNIKLFLSNPDLENTLNGYFDEVHLVKTRMFSPKNKNVFVFQAFKNQKSYITVSVVNWEKNFKTLSISESLSRVYDLVSPLEYKYSSLTALNQRIKFIPYRRVTVNNNDSGGFV
jgi:hypothetical protein